MKKNKLLFLVTILVYLFLIGPLVVIMAASFSDTNYLKFPGEGFTLRWYQQVFTMSAFLTKSTTSSPITKRVRSDDLMTSINVSTSGTPGFREGNS